MEETATEDIMESWSKARERFDNTGFVTVGSYTLLRSAEDYEIYHDYHRAHGHGAPLKYPSFVVNMVAHDESEYYEYLSAREILAMASYMPGEPKPLDA